jgi:hypothetical protein
MVLGAGCETRKPQHASVPCCMAAYMARSSRSAVPCKYRFVCFLFMGKFNSWHVAKDFSLSRSCGSPLIRHVLLTQLFEFDT